MRIHFKTMLTVMLLLAAVNVSAQESPFSFIVKAGVNVSNTTIDIGDDDDLMQKQPKIGYNIGVMADYAFSKSFSLQSGLSYTTKGFQLKGIDYWIPRGEAHWVATTNMGYLQVPVLAVYRFNIADNFNFFINAGPYAAYGVNGKVTTKNRYYNLGNKPNDKEEVDTFGDEALKRFDFGLVGGLGAEMNRLMISFNFELGLVGLPGDELIEWGAQDYKNKNASISIGYRF